MDKEKKWKKRIQITVVLIISDMRKDKSSNLEVIRRAENPLSGKATREDEGGRRG